MIEEVVEMGWMCCKGRDKGCRDGVLKAKDEERRKSQMRALPGLALLSVC